MYNKGDREAALRSVVSRILERIIIDKGLLAGRNYVMDRQLGFGRRSSARSLLDLYERVSNVA